MVKLLSAQQTFSVTSSLSWKFARMQTSLSMMAFQSLKELVLPVCENKSIKVINNELMLEIGKRSNKKRNKRLSIRAAMSLVNSRKNASSKLPFAGSSRRNIMSFSSLSKSLGLTADSASSVNK